MYAQRALRCWTEASVAHGGGCGEDRIQCASVKGPTRRWSMGYCQRHEQEKPGRVQRHRKRGRSNVRVKKRDDGQERMVVTKVKMMPAGDSYRAYGMGCGGTEPAASE